VKVLLLSDIYYDSTLTPKALNWLEPARGLGVFASIIIAIRLLALAIGSSVADMIFRTFAGAHHVIIGMGPAAMEYAANHNRMFRKGAIHLADERLPSRSAPCHFRTARRPQGYSSGAPAQGARVVSSSMKAMTPTPGRRRRSWRRNAPSPTCWPTFAIRGFATGSVAIGPTPSVRRQELAPFSYAGGDHATSHACPSALPAGAGPRRAGAAHSDRGLWTGRAGDRARVHRHLRDAG